MAIFAPRWIATVAQTANMQRVVLICPVFEKARAEPMRTGSELAVQNGARNSSSHRIVFDFLTTEDTKINYYFSKLFFEDV